MGQDSSKIASKRRVENAEKVKLLCKENRATVKLSASEIRTLKQLYHRLASLSPENEYIDKQTLLQAADITLRPAFMTNLLFTTTFPGTRGGHKTQVLLLNYFPLEGILAERLFATFDKDKNNVIDYEEFLDSRRFYSPKEEHSDIQGGLALCLCGTVDEKFQLVFDLGDSSSRGVTIDTDYVPATFNVALYNIDDGDGISEDELAVVLKSTLMAATAIVSPICGNNSIGIHNECDINKHVQSIVKDAFEQCDTSQTGKLSPEEFRTWAERHSYILDIIFGHKSFTDKQKISENITAATLKAVEMNSVRCQAQTWVDAPMSSEQLPETSRGYSKAAYLWSPVFPVMLKAPKARSEHTVCVYQGSLYLLGGRGITAYKDFWKYDLEFMTSDWPTPNGEIVISSQWLPKYGVVTSMMRYEKVIARLTSFGATLKKILHALNNWSEVPNNGERPSLIFGHTAVLHKGSMYVYGGEFASCETRIWKYMFDYNEWKLISPDMPCKKTIPGNRRHHSAVTYENKMYVFGGIIDIRGSTNELWSFNFMSHEWDLVSQTPKNSPGPRYEHSAVVYNKAMWIVGGLENYQPKSDLWKWNFGNNSWSKIKNRSAPFPIHGHRVVKCGNAMVIFGGSINGEYHNMIWRFEFDAQNWSEITPHGGVSPPARSAPAVVTLSAFSLPLLPPQLPNSKQNSTCDVPQRTIIEELRPRSSPEYKCTKEPSSFETRSRDWSLSTDSLYQPPITKYGDKRCSVGSVNDFGENAVIAFTNISYQTSTDESQFSTIGETLHPFHATLGNKLRPSERLEEQKEVGEKNIKEVRRTLDRGVCPNNSNTNSENVQLKRLLPHPREGLCIFLVGGKYCGNHEFFAKGVDIWRCDVTKRQKRSNKVTKINVQTADAETATASETSRIKEPCRHNENMKTYGGTSSVPLNPSNASCVDGLRDSFASTCRHDFFKASESRTLALNDGSKAKPSELDTYYGDLVITDLGCSYDHHLLEDD